MNELMIIWLNIKKHIGNDARLFIIIFLLLIAPVLHAQIQVNIQTSVNTFCNGNPCQYSGPTILINEVMLAPSAGDGSIYDSDNTRRGEWIELYNPDICKSIDISCYFLGNNTPDPRNYGGGFTLPQGTIVPARGFVMVRGANAAAVPSNLLVENGGRTVEIVVNDVNKICLGGGNRLWFPNAGGWFAFYDRSGTVQDAISWCSMTNSCMTCNPCIPPASGCSYSGNLSSYNNMPANRKNYITSLTLANYLGQSFHRMPDGGTWESTPSAPTYGTCNSTCIPPPVITCNGQAIVTPSGGTPPYSYLWDDTRATRDSVCNGLCGGIYNVTITDNNGVSTIRQVVINDYVPVVNLKSFAPVCIDHAPFTLNGGTPAGGTYSGTGVSGSIFDPSLAGVGRHVIRYDYSDSLSCHNYDTSSIVVNPVPVISRIDSQTVCSGSATAAVTLVSTPAGARFTWTSSATTGISGNITSGTGNIPSHTLITTSATPGRVTYTITATLNNCAGAVTTFVVIVKPKPTVSYISPQTICSGDSTTAVTLLSVPVGASFAWVSSATSGVSGNITGGTGNIPAQVLSTTAISAGTVIYTIAPTLNNCTGNTRTFAVTVNPNPFVNVIAPQTVCSGSSTTAVTLSSVPMGASYVWTSSANAGITGNTASGSGNIPSQLLTNTAATPGTVTYTITPTLNNCSGATSVFLVTVNPKPAVNAITPQTVCSGGSTSAVTLVSTPPGASYTWTSSATTGITGNTASGSGNIPVQTLTTTAISIGTVTYTITPTMYNCNGATATFVVTVYPNPKINAITPQTVCSGSSTTVVNLSSIPAGATYAWTSSATAGITGNTTSGTGNIPSQLLSTTDTAVGTVTYTITPTLNNCAGLTSTFTVTLNPRPAVNAIASQTVCSGNPSNAVPLVSTPRGARFSWTSSAASGISGNITSGTGNIPAQTLITTANLPGTVIYTITPTLNNCTGSTNTFIINVRPTKRTVLNPIICQGESFTTGIHTYTTTGIYKDTLSTYLGCDSIITTNLVVGQVKHIIIDPVICQGGSFQVGTHHYSVNGTYIDTLITYLGCDSMVTTNLTVNPVPGIIPVDSQTVCSGSPTSAVTLVSLPAGATYTWTSSATSGISGYTASGTGDIPVQTLTTTSNSPGTVRYSITPTLNNCPGAPSAFVVIVKPKPRVNPITSQFICSGASTNAVIIASTPPGASFLWTSSASSGVTGNISNGTDTIPAQILSSTVSSVGTVTYSITPTLNSCEGLARSFVITVTPHITINSVPTQTICSGSSTSAVRLTSVPAGSTYTWTSSASTGVSGNIPSGSGNIPSQRLSTIETTQGMVTYTITPTLNYCTGSVATFVVNINPQPTVDSVSSQTLCSGTSTAAVFLASTPVGANFNWTSTATFGITGNTVSGTGNIPSQTLSTTDTTIGTVTYTITPTLNNCAGPSRVLVVTVNPNPTVNTIPGQPLCSGDSTVQITPVSTPAGASFEWTSSATAGLTGYSTGGTGSIPSQLISNNDTIIGTVTYTITPALNSCIGSAGTLIITVNPVPAINAIDSQTVCAETPSSVVTPVSVPMGATFAWTSSATAGITGNTASGTGNIPAETLFTTAVMPGTVTYSITPTLHNCSGSPATFIIHVKPVKRTVLSPVICEGESFSTGYSSYTTSGIYNDTLATCLGCDSIIITDLTVNPVYVTDNQQQICNGQAYYLNSHTYTTEGTYFDTLMTIAGCDSVIVTQLKINPVYDTNNPQTICEGKTYSFNSHNYTSAGIYYDTLASIAGCDSVIITELTVYPVYSMDNPQSICSGYSYYFNSHFYFTAGTYYDTLATINGCDSIIVTRLTVKPIPAVSIAASANPICDGSSTLLIASGASDYVWGDSLGISGILSLSPSSTTTYTVTGTLNGCYNTASLTVIVHPIPPVNVTPSMASICEGDTVELLARGADSYRWDPSIGLSSSTSAGVIARPPVTTTFLLTGTSLGCSKTVSVTITVNPRPIANFIADPYNVSIIKPVVHFQDMSSGSPPLTWYWTLGNGSTSDFPDFYCTYSDTGRYRVTLWVYNQYGCVDSVHDYVIVHPDYTIFIPNAFTPNNDMKNDRFRAYGTEISEFNMKIFDRWGELIFESDNITKGWDGKYKGELLPKGIYVYYIYFKDVTTTEHYRSGRVSLL